MYYCNRLVAAKWRDYWIIRLCRHNKGSSFELDAFFYTWASVKSSENCQVQVLNQKWLKKLPVSKETLKQKRQLGELKVWLYGSKTKSRLLHINVEKSSYSHCGGKRPQENDTCYSRSTLFLSRLWCVLYWATCTPMYTVTFHNTIRLSDVRLDMVWRWTTEDFDLFFPELGSPEKKQISISACVCIWW